MSCSNQLCLFRSPATSNTLYSGCSAVRCLELLQPAVNRFVFLLPLTPLAVADDFALSQIIACRTDGCVQLS